MYKYNPSIKKLFSSFLEFLDEEKKRGEIENMRIIKLYETTSSDKSIEVDKATDKGTLFLRDKCFYAIIGKNMRKLRKSYKLTSQEIAKDLGVSMQQVMKYENGRNRISIPSLFILCNKFNITLEWFFINEH